MPQKRTVDWWEVDKLQSDLETFPPPEGARGVEHLLQVQREAIPLVFVPGIMGSRMRLAGTDGTGDGSDGLPNLRWDPGDAMFMLRNFLFRGPERRRRMIVGPPEEDFDPGFLEVANTNPYRDGFAGVMGYEGEDKKGSAYLQFLNRLKNYDWGPLAKLFDFPVYAIGYNWSDDPENAGRWIAQKIKDFIQESKNVTGRCEKVIVITHSMGGIVSRAASELCGAQGSILGIIHGVQPITGAPAAYWRMKAGFEGGIIGLEQSALGKSGPNVTCILGNIPGGLALLPNKNHLTNTMQKAWLRILDGNSVIFQAPTDNPYDEIYRVKAEVEQLDEELAPSDNTYWGLVDEDLLNPENRPPKGGNDHDVFDAASGSLPWDTYLRTLKIAEAFHDKLNLQCHPHTICLHGTGRNTADVVELHIESMWFKRTSYPNQGFRGYFTDSAGKKKIAVLQDPQRRSDGTGDGDGTVPVSSATALDAKGRPSPGDMAVGVDHQPAYENAAVQDWAIQAVITMCKLRYYEKRGGAAGDFPAQSSSSAPA